MKKLSLSIVLLAAIVSLLNTGTWLIGNTPTGSNDIAADVPLTNYAQIDGTEQGWQALGEADFMHVNSSLKEGEVTWTWKGKELHCTGVPRSLLSSKKVYTNFEMVLEWKHLEFGGNSGIFVWAPPSHIKKLQASGTPSLTRGIEVQILDPGYKDVFRKKYSKRSDNWFTCHGDVFRVGGGVKFTPFPPISPNGTRSFPSANHTKNVNNWNHYYVRCINGEVRLWVNGHEVSGGTDITPRSGYICLESEKAPLIFRNIRVRELPNPAAVPGNPPGNIPAATKKTQ